MVDEKALNAAVETYAAFPEQGCMKDCIRMILEKYESSRSPQPSENANKQEGIVSIATQDEYKPTENTYINEMLEKHADRADMFTPETEVIETRWVRLMNPETPDKTATIERMARAIYTKRNGKWDYNAWRGDPRIAESYRADAQAAYEAEHS